MKIDSNAKKITVFGTGAYGTALAVMIAENNPKNIINLWSYEKSVSVQINSSRKNSKYLSYVNIPDNIYCTSSLGIASESVDIFIIAVPAKFTVEILTKIKNEINKDSLIIISSKGMSHYKSKYMPVTLAAKSIIGDKTNIAVFTGPSNVKEIMEKKCSSFNFAQNSSYQNFDDIKMLFENDNFSIKHSNDVLAAELGGILKNPVAILFGILDGMDQCGDNTRGIIFSQILKEIKIIFNFYKVNVDEIFNFSCVGDLVTSCFGSENNNKKYGRSIIEKIKKDNKHKTKIRKIVRKIFKKRYHAPKLTVQNLIEGAYTIKPLVKIAEENKLDIPLFKMLFEVLSYNEDPVRLIEIAMDSSKCRFNKS